MGLGLALVREIVRVHDGKIEVRGNEQGGTTFEVRMGMGWNRRIKQKGKIFMIKTRLVGLLSHAKKYIVYTILWQWAALLSQVLAVFSIADFTGNGCVPGSNRTDH